MIPTSNTTIESPAVVQPECVKAHTNHAECATRDSSPNMPLANTQTNSNATWAETKQRIRQPLDLQDARDRFAYEEWEKDAEKKRKAAADHTLVHTFTAREVFQAAEDYFNADLAENKIIYQFKAARNQRKVAKTRLIAALGQYEGFFLDEDDHQEVVPEALGVYKVTKAKFYQRVLDAVLKLASNSSEPRADEIEPASPASLDDIPDFRADLLDFLKLNGEAGREVLRRLCKDSDFASKVHQDDKMPKPLQFLAGLRLELEKNKLPDLDRPVGFGFSSK